MERARTWGVQVLVISAIAAALLAPAAGARGQLPAAAVPWVAQYTVEASGSQTGSWTEHRHGTGGCDGGETGSGNEDVTLRPQGTTPVFATGVGPTLTSIMVAAGVDVPVPGDPLSVPQTLLTASASVMRGGSVRQGAPPDPTQCPSGDGGGTPPTPDCGTKSMTLKLWFSEHTKLLQFEQPDGSVPDDPFTDCPYLGPGLAPTWLPVDVLLPPSGWGPGPPIGSAAGHGMPVELHGETSTDQHDADIDASANEHLTLRFVPVYVTPTIVLGNVTSERVGSDGSIGVPITCPSGEKPGCSGTVALAIDVAGASAVRAAAVPAVVTVTKAAFKLKPGARQRLTLRIAHASKQYLRSLSQAPLTIMVTVGGKHPVRYVASRTKLRA